MSKQTNTFNRLLLVLKNLREKTINWINTKFLVGFKPVELEIEHVQ